MDKIELENKIHNKPVTMTFISKSGKRCVRNGIAERSQHPNTILIKNPVTDKYASACVGKIFAIRGKESKDNFYLYTDHGILEARKLKPIKEIEQDVINVEDTLKTLMEIHLKSFELSPAERLRKQFGVK